MFSSPIAGLECLFKINIFKTITTVDDVMNVSYNSTNKAYVRLERVC